MKYSTIVEHSEDNLQMILDKASDFEREAILDGVISRRLSLYDVEQLTNDIKEYRAKMKREYLSLVAFGKTFNRQFATDNNKCFETAKILFWKIRSCLSETKRIFLKFCKRCQGQSRYEVNYKASVFSHNILCNKGYMPDLFGEESFPEAVSELCSEMEAFFNELTECIKLCIGILQTEDDTRNDPALLLQIYNKDAEDTRSSQREIIRQISQGKLKIAIDPMSQQKKSTKTLQAFLAETFHKFDTAEFSLHILYTDIEKGLNNGLDETEALLWKNNPDFVPQIRLVIEHFDELDPKGRLDKASGMHKIDGNIMAKFMDWCHISNTGYEKVFIENYFNKHYNGQYLTPKDQYDKHCQKQKPQQTRRQTSRIQPKNRTTVDKIREGGAKKTQPSRQLLIISQHTIQTFGLPNKDNPFFLIQNHIDSVKSGAYFSATSLSQSQEKCTETEVLKARPGWTRWLRAGHQ